MAKRRRELPSEAQERIDRAVAYVDRRLSSDEDTATVVRDLLVDLFGDREAYRRLRGGASPSPVAQARLRSYEPGHALTESERWAEQDPGDVRASKPLRYLWRCFDRSPLADNLAFALPFRQTLANHLFAEAGDGLQLFSGIKIQCGHNVRMGDNVVVHNGVLLDDRGELVIGDRVSVADEAHLHTHSHHIVDQADVTNYRTEVADDARIGYGAMVSAGTRVGENAVVGASAMARGDVPAHHVAVGSPAESVKVKPGWEEVAEEPGALEDRSEERALDSTVPEDVDVHDEFERDLAPPGEP
ncbi:MAG: acyltransferase [Haloferacaceae archaeon]